MNGEVTFHYDRPGHRWKVRVVARDAFRVKPLYWWKDLMRLTRKADNRRDCVAQLLAEAVQYEAYCTERLDITARELVIGWKDAKYYARQVSKDALRKIRQTNKTLEDNVYEAENQLHKITRIKEILKTQGQVVFTPLEEK